jgi:calcineurin-like phosphoesterase
MDEEMDMSILEGKTAIITGTGSVVDYDCTVGLRKKTQMS